MIVQLVEIVQRDRIVQGEGDCTAGRDCTEIGLYKGRVIVQLVEIVQRDRIVQGEGDCTVGRDCTER